KNYKTIFAARTTSGWLRSGHPLLHNSDSALPTVRRSSARLRPKLWNEKLPFLRSRDRALGLIHLECELLRDESRDAFHHPLTRALAANVDVAVVRVANTAMSPALQLTVEFVEHEV